MTEYSVIMKLANAAGMLWIAVYDQRTRQIARIPLYALLALAWVRMLCNLLDDRLDAQGLLLRVGFAFMYYTLFYLASRCSGGQLGMGDVKLIGVQSLWYSEAVYPSVLLLAFLLCSLYVLVGTVWKRWRRRDTVAFAPFLTVSGIWHLVF